MFANVSVPEILKSEKFVRMSLKQNKPKNKAENERITHQYTYAWVGIINKQALIRISHQTT